MPLVFQGRHQNQLSICCAISKILVLSSDCLYILFLRLAQCRFRQQVTFGTLTQLHLYFSGIYLIELFMCVIQDQPYVDYSSMFKPVIYCSVLIPAISQITSPHQITSPQLHHIQPLLTLGEPIEADETYDDPKVLCVFYDIRCLI